MPSYDDDLPTCEEEHLLKQLVDNDELHERMQVLVQLKDLIIGSKRCKIALYYGGLLEILPKLLQQYSTSINIDMLIQILDCISSFAKFNNKNIMNRLVELDYIEQVFSLLTIQTNSTHFYESCLRCLRSFFLTKIFSNSYLTPTPFILLTDSNKPEIIPFVSQTNHFLSNDQCLPVENLFENPQILEILYQLLPISISTQTLILEILCCACVNPRQQNQILEKDFIQFVMNTLVENVLVNNRLNLVGLNNEYLTGACLKFLCSICYENPSIAQQLQTTVHSKTDQSLCDIISSLLNATNRPLVISYYASKFFVNLCKTKVLPCDHLNVSQKSLTTLVHLCTKPTSKKCIIMCIACLDTLVYLLNGNSTLHHMAMYTEQFLNELFSYLFIPYKVFGDDVDQTMIVRIRASALILLGVLSSYHEDIKKRIADRENLVLTAIECYHSRHSSLKIAALCLFHGLSRSVQQLRTAFNEAIGNILLDALKSTDLAVVKIASSVITNAVLEFSACRTRLLAGGILDIVLSFLSHSDHELSINSIWTLRNLSYLSTVKVKQDIINGLTVTRIYSLLEESTDERFLLCLLSLLRNMFDENDTETLLPLINGLKFMTTLQIMRERNYCEEITHEINLLIDHLNSDNYSIQQRISSESINVNCRTSLCPDYPFDETDRLDCS